MEDEYKEWLEMVQQELHDLNKLLDRKAERIAIEPFVEQTKKKQTQLKSKRSSYTIPLNISQELANHNFGFDIYNDFNVFFQIFGRNARTKLDNISLSDFASIKYVDNVFHKMSIDFSTQLQEFTEIYMSKIDIKMKSFLDRFQVFKLEIESKLADLEGRIIKLQTKMARIYRKQYGSKMRKTSQFGTKSIKATRSSINTLVGESLLLCSSTKKLIESALRE